jgi:cytochrome c553
MFRRFASAIFGIGFALAIAPAYAADEIEAKAQVCAACHGNKGVPTDPKTMPVIWGQQESYLMKQLRDFRNGERPSAVMEPIAKGLAEADLRPLAAYFAAKPWPSKQAQAKPPAAPKGIAQCQACHQPNFQGGMPAPRLAGLSYEYLVSAMRAFAKDERHNNLDMPGFMRALTDQERNAIARYLSAL